MLHDMALRQQFHPTLEADANDRSEQLSAYRQPNLETSDSATGSAEQPVWKPTEQSLPLSTKPEINDAARYKVPSSSATPAQDGRIRMENSERFLKRKEVRFGDYVLGQTIGESKFSKVK